MSRSNKNDSTSRRFRNSSEFGPILIKNELEKIVYKKKNSYIVLKFW